MTLRILLASSLATTAPLAIPAIAWAEPADHGAWTVDAGLISVEAAVYASSNPEEFERSLRVE